MDDEALSPVIGTILLVAIAVVLAGVVFVMVQSQNEAPQEVPRVGFNPDHAGAGGSLTVVRVDADAGEFSWDNIAIAEGSTASCTLPTGQVSAGDVIECTTEGTLALSYTLPGGDTVLLYETEVR